MASEQDNPPGQENTPADTPADTGVDAPPAAEAAGAPAATRTPARKRATRRVAAPAASPAPAPAAAAAPAGPAEATESDQSATAAARPDAPAAPAPRKRATRKKAAAPAPAAEPDAAAASPNAEPAATAETTPAPRKRAVRKRAAAPASAPATSASDPAASAGPGASDVQEAPVSDLAIAALTDEDAEALLAEGAALAAAAEAEAAGEQPAALNTFGLLFQAPDPAAVPTPRRRRATAPQQAAPEPAAAETDAEETSASTEDAAEAPARPTRRTRATRGAASARAPQADDEAAQEVDVAEDTPGQDGDSDAEGGRRRRRRGGKGRRRTGSGDDTEPGTDGDAADDGDAGQEPADDRDRSDTGDDDAAPSGRRRTRRRRRSGSAGEEQDPPGTVTRVREPRRERDEATGIKGSTRLEAKKQRRREGREAGRRRTIITEAEFLARRESVERVMVVRQDGERTQIGVLEDGVLVEHYVSKADSAQSGSMAGNVYLGRVQNVLPSMEAAFVDIGKGRNAVLYAGEVNWDAAGLEAHKARRIENALSSGQGVLVQVTKDPIGHKGARLTSQVSLPGRYLVYVPEGRMTGISRKLPDVERARLKKILKEVVPPDAGVIVRTAAEGASEAELRADVERLAKIWENIGRKAKNGNAPALLHGEVDLTVRVIRDVFNEDFASMVVAGDEAWATVNDYIASVAPDLAPKLTRWTGTGDAFAEYRIDEQLAKAMDRKVWLPSGGSLVIDRTEAMTVIDVNTGKFVGAGGNLEETVTKNNIEAAEEIVRQLRLRDIGGIIVIDFIDMVLESNRDLVVRRLLECLGRDRTKHQVAEVTSLGLVQMTRKRVGAGLIEVFSEPCEHCAGRGIIVSTTPVDRPAAPAPEQGNGRRRRGRGNGTSSGGTSSGSGPSGGSGEPVGGSASSGPGAAEPAKGGPTPAQIAAAAYAALHHDRKPAPVDAEVEAGVDAGADDAPAADAPEAADAALAPAPVPAGDDAAGVATESARMGWPQDGEEHLVAGSPTGLGWPPADDVPLGPPSPAPATASRSRRRRGRVSAPAGPPPRLDEETAQDVSQAGSDSGRYEGDQG